MKICHYINLVLFINDMKEKDFLIYQIYHLQMNSNIIYSKRLYI